MTDMKEMSLALAEEYSAAALLGETSFQLRLCIHGEYNEMRLIL
jgi:hypothetical protein